MHRIPLREASLRGEHRGFPRRGFSRFARLVSLLVVSSVVVSFSPPQPLCASENCDPLIFCYRDADCEGQGSCNACPGATFPWNPGQCGWVV